MSNSQKYIRVCVSLNDSGKLIKKEDLDQIVKRKDIKELYASTYYYTEDQYKDFQVKKSIAGVRNVKTDKIWFDFDNESNPDLARKDSIEVVKRLKDAGFKESSIQAFFSGSKGFNLVVNVNKELNPTQVANICSKFAKDLETFDTTLYDSSQILRVPATQHQKTSNFKIPLTISELQTLNLQDIRKKSSSISKEEVLNMSVTNDVENLPSELENISNTDSTNKLVERPKMEFDIKSKPREWRDYKWALLNAYMVKPEERHASLMIIAATCRSLGYTEEYAKAMCLVFDEKFVKKTGKPPVEDLDSNIIPSVYSEFWNGGAYSFKNSLFLQKYAERIGIKVDESTDEPTITIENAYSMFKDYACNIDKLTIKTGIDRLDENVRMTIGMSIGIVAAPGVGKSTLALQILNSMSHSNEQSIFFSYDMYHALVFQKLIQKHLRVTDSQIFDKFKNNDVDFQKNVVNTLKKEYSNVEFCFKTGQTPDDIEKTILHTEQKTGKKLRLAVVDYSELVLTDVSDMTAGSAVVAQKLREIATKHNICIIVLLQPNKQAGTPADELKSYRNLKGSSSAEQALSVILGMSRPGYNPRYPEDDNYITIKCLKNRMGGLFTLDLGWNGATGDIYELSEEQEQRLIVVRKRAKEEESKDGSSNDGWT